MELYEQRLNRHTRRYSRINPSTSYMLCCTRLGWRDLMNTFKSNLKYAFTNVPRELFVLIAQACFWVALTSAVLYFGGVV